MKAVIGQFFKKADDALKRVEEMKRLQKGRCSFVAIGNEKKGFIVISEGSARSCGINVPVSARRYKNLQA